MRQYVQARRSLKQLTDVIVHTVIAKAQEYVLGKPFILCFIQHPNCKTVARQLHLKSDLHYIVDSDLVCSLSRSPHFVLQYPLL